MSRRYRTPQKTLPLATVTKSAAIDLMYSGRPKMRRNRRHIAAVFAPATIGSPQLLVFLVVKGPSLRIWILSVFIFHLEEKNEDKGWVNHLGLSLKPKSPIIFFWHKNCEKLMQVAQGKQVVSLFYFILFFLSCFLILCGLRVSLVRGGIWLMKNSRAKIAEKMSLCVVWLKGKKRKFLDEVQAFFTWAHTKLVSLKWREKRCESAC